MKMLKHTLVLFGALILSACGGGGGSAGTPVLGSGSGTPVVGGTGSTSGTTTLTAGTVLVTTSSTTVTSSTPATVTATVRSPAGALLAGQVVSFSSTGALGAFTPATALTDTNGVATTQLTPASSTANGADLVVATTSIGAVAASGTIGFQIVSSSGSASGNPTIAVSLSSTSVSTASPGTLTAVVSDSSGAPLPGQVVKFSSVSGLGLFTPASALTDTSGKVVVKLTPSGSTTNGADLAVAQTSVNGTGTQLSANIGFTALVTAGGTTAGAPTMALSLSTQTVTTSTPATVTAVVRDALGVGVQGQVVKFNTVGGLGTLNVSSALTNSNGSASVSLTATNAGTSGADQVLASTTVGTTTLQASQGFQLTASNISIASFASDLGSGTLSAYGQSNLTVSLAGATSGTPANVTLTSTCTAKGKATITPASVATTTGSATFTYRDSGCGATDTFDSLQASLTGTAAVASLAIPLSAPAVGSISFVSASPQTIFLKASGYQENATVLFRVVDGAGNGVPNRSVDLSASTLAGGLTIDGGTGPLTKTSDSLGNVSVLVNSGTVPTPVRIKATLSGGTITTVSSNLSIAVGRPSQINFSLAQKTKNIEGWDIDGTTNTYSIIASDRLSNPVPVNTAINFVAEGGSIEPSKFTALSSAGLATATANFVSASPRPADGRVTVLAYALGEESFIDTNGNNVWDAGEPFQDLGNIFIDRPFNGVFNASVDQFIALSIPGVNASQACSPSTSSLLVLDKSIPSAPGTCDGAWGQAYVRRAVETVLSTSAARPVWLGGQGALNTVDGSSCSTRSVGPLITGYDSSGNTTTAPFYPVGGAIGLFRPPVSGVAQLTGTVVMLASDGNGVRLNPMAAGTTITATATAGLTIDATVGGSPVPSSLEATVAVLGYAFSPDTTTTTGTPPVTTTVPGTTSGTITFNFTSPSGLTTSVPVFVSRNAPPSTGACP